MPTTKVSILFAQWRIIGMVRLFVFSLEKPKINAFGSKINKSILVSYWICGKTNKKDVINTVFKPPNLFNNPLNKIPLNKNSSKVIHQSYRFLKISLAYN